MHYHGRWYVCMGNSWRTLRPAIDEDLKEIIELPENRYAAFSLYEISEEEALSLGLGRKRSDLESIPADWENMSFLERKCWLPEYYKLYDFRTNEIEYAPYTPNEIRETVIPFLKRIESSEKDGLIIE